MYKVDEVVSAQIPFAFFKVLPSMVVYEAPFSSDFPTPSPFEFPFLLDKVTKRLDDATVTLKGKFSDDRIGWYPEPTGQLSQV